MQQYTEESDLIRPVFGEELVSIDHIGSTSVPNMRAKPVIDILVVVNPASDIKLFYDGMQSCGYNCRGECLDAPIPGTPGRFYFTKDKNGSRYSHVHVCHYGHAQLKEFLSLRDYLRAHPNAASEYGNLKADLAAKFSQDNFQYMTGKDKYIKQLIARSLAWHRARRSSL